MDVIIPGALFLSFLVACILFFYIGRSMSRVIKEQLYLVANRSIMLGAQIQVTFKNKVEKKLYSLVQIMPKSCVSMSEVHRVLEKATISAALDTETSDIDFKNVFESKIKIHMSKHLLHAVIEKLTIVL